jgi:CubicO group peptidase (beta-lactamase class C family)
MRFCKMLANGGELDGRRILGPRTLAYMATNHLPGGVDLDAMAQAGAETSRAGVGFGLGFAVLLDPTVSQTLGSIGEYYWGGAASTAFFVSPEDDLIAIFLTQVMQAKQLLRRELRVTTYQALMD